MIALAALELAGPAAPWRELGFVVAGGALRLGAVELRFGAPGAGIRAWTLSGTGPPALDGLPTAWTDGPPDGAPPAHPNGATRLDHVVVTTPDLVRTERALAAAGLERRRRRDAASAQQSFYRLGEVILEVVAPATAAAGPATAAAGPAAFWGLVPVVADLDALAARLGDRLGPARAAVQPGRRIATVRRPAGLGLPVAFLTP